MSSKLTARIKNIAPSARPNPRHRLPIERPPMPLVTAENRHDIIRQVVTPMHIMPYEEQLRKKESYCRNALRLLASNLMQAGTRIRVDVRRLPCPVQNIRPSPVSRSYRNKDEFSIWRGYDSQPTVGFFAFSISNLGDTVCVEPDEVEIVRPSHTAVAHIFQEYIRKVAKVGISYNLGQDGGWRRFTARSNNDDELMLIGQLNPRTLNAKQAIDEKSRFLDYVLNEAQKRKFISDDGTEKNLNVKSLFVQQCPHTRCPHSLVPYELLHGVPVIHESINGFKIQVSPDTFLQQNTMAAQVLYNNILDAIHETAGDHREELAIDACTGSGVIAMHLANDKTQVVGIDNSEAAIDDAKTNSKINGIKNIDFICQDLEIVLERVLEKYSKNVKDVLMVCNPPRQGLKHAAIDAIRDCRNIKRLIYVSCKPDGAAMDNFIKLCQRQVGRNIAPFIPTIAIPVDMFPHTEHCELVIVFERLEE